MKPKTMFPILIFTGLSACATAPTDQVGPPTDAIEAKIAAAVEESAAANRAIAEIEVATAGPVRRPPGSIVPDNVVLPPEVVEPLTIDWDGPLETFLATMAARAGYQLRVSGRPPANQVMVTLTADSEPLYRVVREAGNQVHGYADIMLNPTARVIEIRYGG